MSESTKKIVPVKSHKRTLTGAVVSTKMKDTIVVLTHRFVKHPKYKKFMQVSKRYKAHDAGNTAKEGEKVTIIECAPISKDKHFTLMVTPK
jgi:small subunit ribosomal protein S17